MDTKTEKTLRKLIEVMPEELKADWHFDAENIGRGYGSAYGIRSPHTSLGIDVQCSSSFRQDRFFCENPMDYKKLGNILAAYVAAANPANVLDLLIEVQELRHELRQSQDHARHLFDELESTQADRNVAQDRIDRMNEPAKCGHPERYWKVEVNQDAWCTMCAVENAGWPKANSEEQLRQALDDLIRVIDASTYGEDVIHHHTCPAPDHGKCTCGTYEAIDAARKLIAKHTDKRPQENTHE